MAVARQLASALAAHDAGIIHCDVEPRNVLSPSAGNDSWLSDFGLCLIRDAGRATETGEVAGQRALLAPGLEEGGQLDAAADADVYSLRRLFYYTVLGGVVMPREALSQPQHAAVFPSGRRRRRVHLRVRARDRHRAAPSCAGPLDMAWLPRSPSSYGRSEGSGLETSDRTAEGRFRQEACCSPASDADVDLILLEGEVAGDRGHFGEGRRVAPRDRLVRRLGGSPVGGGTLERAMGRSPGERDERGHGQEIARLPGVPASSAAPRHVPSRSIPAGARELGTGWRRRTRCRVHPRGCGGAPTAPCSFARTSST